MIDKEFIENLPENPFETGVQISDVILSSHNEFIEDYSEEDLEAYLKPFGLFQSLAEANGWSYDYPKITLDINKTIREIVAFFSNQKEKLKAKSDLYKLNQYNLKFEKIKSQYDTHFGKLFSYAFEEKDTDRIQLLLSELRDVVTTSEDLEEDQKDRVLKRLEKLQEELNHNISDLDRFWGLVGDAGVVMAKAGKEAKPLIERIREVTSIIWKIQSRTENLPEDTPQPLIVNETGKKGLINSLLRTHT